MSAVEGVTVRSMPVALEPKMLPVLTPEHERVIAAATAFGIHINDHGWSRGLGYDCTVTISATNGFEASNALTELHAAVNALRAQGTR